MVELLRVSGVAVESKRCCGFKITRFFAFGKLSDDTSSNLPKAGTITKHVFYVFLPFYNSVYGNRISCINFKPAKDIFIELGTNVKHGQLMSGYETHNCTYSLGGIMSLFNFKYGNRVYSITLKQSKDSFRKH